MPKTNILLLGGQRWLQQITAKQYSQLYNVNFEGYSKSVWIEKIQWNQMSILSNLVS